MAAGKLEDHPLVGLWTDDNEGDAARIISVYAISDNTGDRVLVHYPFTDEIEVYDIATVDDWTLYRTREACDAAVASRSAKSPTEAA